MSDSNEVWELRVEYLPTRQSTKSQLFRELENAKFMAKTWVNNGPIHWETADEGKTWVGCSDEYKDKVFHVRKLHLPDWEEHTPPSDSGKVETDTATVLKEVFYGYQPKSKRSRDNLVRYVDHIKRLAVASEFLYMAEVQIMHAADSLEGLRTLKALRGLVAIEDAEKNVGVAIKMVNSELEALEDEEPA